MPPVRTDKFPLDRMWKPKCKKKLLKAFIAKANREPTRQEQLGKTFSDRSMRAGEQVKIREGWGQKKTDKYSKEESKTFYQCFLKVLKIQVGASME